MTAAIKKEMAGYIERTVGMSMEEIENTCSEDIHRHLVNRQGHNFSIEKEPGGATRGSVLLQRGRTRTREETNRRFNDRFK